jgi:hypothetical protein
VLSAEIQMRMLSSDVSAVVSSWVIVMGVGLHPCLACGIPRDLEGTISGERPLSAAAPPRVVSATRTGGRRPTHPGSDTFHPHGRVGEPAVACGPTGSKENDP